VLMGEGAEDLLADHAQAQRGFGNDVELGPVRIITAEVTAESIAAACPEPSASLVAVVATPEDSGHNVATRLAAVQPELMVLAWSSAAVGMPEEPLIARLYPFGLSLVGRDGGPPIDNWTRVARLLHEEYVLSSAATGAVTPPSRRPWDAGLPLFYQTSNVRQLSCLISEVTRLGRSWSAPLAETSGPEPWTEAEIDMLAAAEHRSWVSFYLAHGWKLGPTRDDSKLRHHLLIDWDQLAEEVRQANRNSVYRGLVLLESLGYRSTRQPVSASSSETERELPHPPSKG
jgi:RyR domain